MTPARTVVLAIACAAVVVAGDTAAFSCRNGAYVPAGWVDRADDGGAVRALTERLLNANVHDYFIVVGGHTAEWARRLQPFQRAVRAQDGESRLYAMIGRRLCPSQGTCSDLRDAAVQGQIVATAASLWTMGFDGVQLDLEVLTQDDPSFLDLLRKLQVAKPAGKHLSVAGYMLAPDAAMREAIHPQPSTKAPILQWSRSYYESVFPLTDHVMVMNYDTALRDAGEYSRYTAWQTRELLSLAARHGSSLQIGVPSNVPGRMGLYDRQAENLASASRGIADALTALGGSCPPRFGVAVFTEAGLTPELLDTFRQFWATH
jgi:hypothetical protein